MSNAAIAHMICNSFKGVAILNDAIKNSSKKAVGAVKKGSDGWKYYPRT